MLAFVTVVSQIKPEFKFYVWSKNFDLMLMYVITQSDSSKWGDFQHATTYVGTFMTSNKGKSNSVQEPTYSILK